MTLSLATGDSIHSFGSSPHGAPLNNHYLVAFDRILQPQLVFEMHRALLSTELPDHLFDSLEFKVTQRIALSLLELQQFSRSLPFG
jgi:hypothetical protein